MVQRRKGEPAGRGRQRSSWHRGLRRTQAEKVVSGSQAFQSHNTLTLGKSPTTRPRRQRAQTLRGLSLPPTPQGHGRAERTCPAPHRQASRGPACGHPAGPDLTAPQAAPALAQEHRGRSGPSCLLGTPHMWPAHCRDLTGSPRRYCRGSARPHRSTSTTQTDMEQNPTHAIRKGRNRRRRP